MEKQDLREHSDNELSMLVFNDEFFYNERHRYGFLALIDSYFVYTDEQLTVLKDDLLEDLEEEVEHGTM